MTAIFEFLVYRLATYEQLWLFHDSEACDWLSYENNLESEGLAEPLSALTLVFFGDSWKEGCPRGPHGGPPYSRQLDLTLPKLVVSRACVCGILFLSFAMIP